MEGYGKGRDNIVPKFSYPKKRLLQLLSEDEIERIHFSSMKNIEQCIYAVYDRIEDLRTKLLQLRE